MLLGDGDGDGAKRLPLCVFDARFVTTHDAIAGFSVESRGVLCA